MLGASLVNFGAQTRAAVAQDLFAPTGRAGWAAQEKEKATAACKLLAFYSLKADQLKEKQDQQLKDQEAAGRFGPWGPDLVQAAQKYGQDPAALYRVMICESKGAPDADNGVCKGLFQFNPSTWAGTPYAGQSIFDGRAQIMAAAWMFSQGRKDEWTCQ